MRLSYWGLILAAIGGVLLVVALILGDITESVSARLSLTCGTLFCLIGVLLLGITALGWMRSGQ